ncbi:DUF4190 domain-containing protein [Amycolatopsis sp. CA-128772]|uniref:DUF4190 domain-containing protein n=1 Tax=Amycolatopsis sp. CA-128772 TaxID=2073159 RepID=UPI000CD16944|nr:DUF4190 domain-containing protein [Amycolatopsis sp. CA-128772]
MGESTTGPGKRDGYATASLVTGVLGCFGVTAVLGMVFGIAALARIRRTGDRGRAWAIGGIAAGVAWAVALPIVSTVWFFAALSASNAPIAAMEVENCYDKAFPGRDAVRVPCAGEHDGVVFDAFTVASPQTPYPGDPEAAAEVDRSCQDRLSTRFGGGFEIPQSLVLVGYAPDEQAWSAGARIGTCGLEGRSGRLTGPLPR